MLDLRVESRESKKDAEMKLANCWERTKPGPINVLWQIMWNCYSNRKVISLRLRRGEADGADDRVEGGNSIRNALIFALMLIHLVRRQC